jgi:RND family efflux transporter MFP subunit
MQNPARSQRLPGALGIAILIVFLGAGGALWLSRSGRGESRHNAGAKNQEGPTAKQIPGVGVIKPQKGGLARITNMPGTIRAFDVAPLHAMVSGYVKELKVDRGDRVRKGQLLASLDNPEIEVGVVQAEASLEHSRALVGEARARVKAAQAGEKAALAAKREATSNLERSVAQRTYRSKAFDRLSDLARRNAIEQRVVDESQDEYEAAVAAEHSAQAGIETAEAKLEEAKAAVDLASADLVTATAQVSISQANLDKAKVMQNFTRIEAPFAGVITQRGEDIHPGAFIRAATEGVAEPLLTVARTDLMRTIVPIADSDVPYCNVGDPAVIRLDVLGGRAFPGKVSRLAESEDLKARTMRIEVDLPNPDGVLRDGMFGRALIQLEPPSQDLIIPVSCLVEHRGEGEATAYVVKNGKIQRASLRLGRDDGVNVEVLSGLSSDDQVILQPSDSTREGAEVRPEPVARSESNGSGG